MAAENKSVIFSDIFGVIHDGKELINDSATWFSNQKQSEKQIILISNASLLSKEAGESLSKKGFHQNIHYDHIVTSGEFFLESFKQKDHPIFNLFSKYQPLKTYNFNLVKNPVGAEFIYIGIPRIDGKDIELSNLMNLYNCDSINSLLQQNIIELEPDISLLKPHHKIICINPDAVAEKEIFIRQGFIALYLKNKGFDVEFYGKPFPGILKFAAEKYSASLENSYFIGDQISTDIALANQFGIHSILINSPITNLTSGINYFKASTIAIPDRVVNSLFEI